MSKKLEALQKQAAAIQVQIAQAELAEKNKSRTERLTIKILTKYPELFLCDPAILEKHLDQSFATIVASLKSSEFTKPAQLPKAGNKGNPLQAGQVTTPDL